MMSRVRLVCMYMCGQVQVVYDTLCLVIEEALKWVLKFFVAVFTLILCITR